MKSGELKTIEAFRQAIAQFNLDKQHPERMACCKKRFHAQLNAGDPEAPINPETRKPRIYTRLDMFIRAMLQRQFRQNS